MIRDEAAHREARQQLWVLAIVVTLGMSLWFSISAVADQLAERWELGDTGQSNLIIAVQIGFVAGTILSALLNVADSISPPRLITSSLLLGALANGTILWVDDTSSALAVDRLRLVLALRFLTGIAMAGIYPPAMKLLATWFQTGRGLAIGIMVGALTVGSASPQLLSWFAVGDQMTTWVVGMSSLLALMAAFLAGTVLRTGPALPPLARFQWDYCVTMWSDEPLRRANFGYLGHMWELYAMWHWMPVLLKDSYGAAGYSAAHGRLASFAVIAIGGLGCVAAGYYGDRLGRCAVTIASLLVSGSCALLVGLFVEAPLLLTALGLIWGFSVVADSAQFSAAVSELSDQQLVGTALTMQTCCGFLLTTASIHAIGWLRGPGENTGTALAVLAIGPAFGIWNMWRLGTMPAAERLAGGKG